MPDQRKKPDKPEDNKAGGSVYRIKDVTQSAWEKGALPLPGLTPDSAPKLTPMNKAEEDIAVDLAMTGEIPLALILEALAKQEAATKREAATKQRPAAKQGATEKRQKKTPAAQRPVAQPPLPPLPPEASAAVEPYASVMIRPDEILTPTAKQPEAQRKEPEAPSAPPKKPQRQKKSEPPKKAPIPAARPAQKADPKKVKEAKEEMAAMAKRAKPVPPKQSKPVMEASQELTPAPPPKQPGPKKPEKLEKPKNQQPAETRPAKSPKQAKPPVSRPVRPAAEQKKPAPPKTAKKSEPKAPKAPLIPEKWKQPFVPRAKKPVVPYTEKKQPPMPKRETKRETSASHAVSGRPKAWLEAADALWTDDVPLYNIPYTQIVRNFGRAVYFFGLRAARPLLLFRRRALPALAQPFLALWYIFRALLMAVYHVTIRRMQESLHAAKDARAQRIAGEDAKQPFPKAALGFFGDYRMVLLTLLNTLMPLGALAVLLVVVFQVSEKTYALKVTYNGQVMYVANEAAFLAAQESALSHITAEEGAVGAAAAKYEIVEVSKVALIDENTARDAIWQHYPEEMANACGVYVNGELSAVVRSESDASSTLESIKQEHARRMQLDEGDTVGFVENIELVQSIYPVNTQKTMDAEGLYKLLTGAKEGEVYEIAGVDDSLYTIAKRHDTTDRWLERLNPQYVDNYLHEGDKVVIAKEVSYLQLTVTKTETSTAEVAYQTIDTNTSNLYKGEIRTTTKGVNGEELITRRVTYVNGSPTESVEIARIRTREPVDERRQIGTKSTRVVTSRGEVININPSAQGFVWPTPSLSQITSPYGPRGRGFHTGMDISGSHASGKLVVAAKDGTVEAVMHSGSGYGNQIVINHGNGVKTRYAHLYSGSISVSSGDRVTAGQPIARVGSTGNSTGPHLHFEVIINGRTHNPRNYLKR